MGHEIIFAKKILAGKNEKCSGNYEITLYKNESGKEVLSICGSLYGKGFQEYGQCISEITKHFPTEKNKRIEEIWKRWHLNDLHAGCEHQREFEKEPYEKHADCVCHICNYKYGTAWKYEELPKEIIKEIESL